MDVRYYLSVFPTEAFISSQLTPAAFGAYMAAGAKYGSYEKIAFVEVEPGFGDYFDWKYAKERTVAHSDGEPKHSVWLSAYRSLEHVPIEAMKSMYLTTNDGRTLELQKETFSPLEGGSGYFVYQELCPVQPLVVTVYDPKDFAAYMTHRDIKVRVPRICFADLKVINFDDLERTGNLGHTYDRNLDHLKACIRAVTGTQEKKVKNVERGHVDSFSYQIISSGIYVGDGEEIVRYPMPTIDEIRRDHYDWGRSAMIL